MGITLLLWILISIADGVRDAFCFHNRSAAAPVLKPDIHIILHSHRILIAIALLIHCSGILEGIFTTVLMILLFPFFHDGSYYYTRWLISDGKVYPGRWKDQSISTSAKFSFNYEVRSILFLIAILLYLIYQFIPLALFLIQLS
jgi:hypothetical protein